MIGPMDYLKGRPADIISDKEPQKVSKDHRDKKTYLEGAPPGVI